MSTVLLHSMENQRVPWLVISRISRNMMRLCEVRLPEGPGYQRPAPSFWMVWGSCHKAAWLSSPMFATKKPLPQAATQGTGAEVGVSKVRWGCSGHFPVLGEP